MHYSLILQPVSCTQLPAAMQSEISEVNGTPPEYRHLHVQAVEENKTAEGNP